ncbi:8-oxo-dGTP pyrophosphatase MutT (NUDIX family) [Friedmanniella endophytica]|uniref:8-oxo-dGTP pyrophosphatase MutT (NUDIX family) n=1 Tax=Microlunatus kandeliicorticis TaxID=1759536 RepID=A0A7W3IUI7_9ACTN|nr:NUDIX hydrolase [Microlunatus kandeliicorticis]MBA8795506.1 8-oxo-dGTP pyrophosphatase MutT (NUDIX family) [Microlunatus kandeliicorticis]
MSGALGVEDAGDGIARLSWSAEPAAAPLGGADEAQALQDRLTRTAETLLSGAVFRRLELTVRADDPWGRRAVLRSGFRQEGVRRRALLGPDGVAVDAVLFARLTEDPVGGAVGFSAVMNSALPRKRLIAHVLYRDADGRVLLCQTRFKTDWELPGGIVEPFEAPRLGAAREVREELGVDLPIGPLLAVDWMPPYLGWDDALELIFDGGLVTEADLAGFTLQPSEIAAVRLVTLAEAADHLTPLARRRLELITTLPAGRTVLLEDGSLPA